MMFHISEVLSVTTGYLLAESKMDGLYKILSYMVSQRLFTHQLPRAAKPCKKHIQSIYPEFIEQPNPKNKERMTEKEMQDYIEKMTKKIGEWIDITPLPPGQFDFIDPIEELCALIGKDKVIVIDASSNSPYPKQQEG